MRLLALALFGFALVPSTEARADDAPAAAAAVTAAPPASSSQSDEDLELDPVQPDFTVVNLPTSLRLPRHKLGFRVTHRFARPLGQGSFRDLLSDFFGFDNGAQIGLELRYGVFGGTQLGIYRTSDRTIQFFAQHELLRQGRSPVGVDVYATEEGVDNLSDEFSPGVVLLLSRKFGTRAALYAMPSWVGNTNALPKHAGEEDNTFLLGLAARVSVMSDTYLVAEYLPRIAGHRHAEHSHVSFGFEHRVGGHNFQISFSNSIGTTLAQIARGAGLVTHTHGAPSENVASAPQNWFIGFNISRKFF